MNIEAARTAIQATMDAVEEAYRMVCVAKAALADAEIPTEPESGIGLESFAWKGAIISHPSGLPAGYRYGEGEAGGKRTCQWKWNALILHAVMSAGTKTATGKSVRWYHFTTNGQPSPLLSAYKWKHTHTATEEGVTWYRYAGG